MIFSSKNESDLDELRIGMGATLSVHSAHMSRASQSEPNRCESVQSEPNRLNRTEPNRVEPNRYHKLRKQYKEKNRYIVLLLIKLF